MIILFICLFVIGIIIIYQGDNEGGTLGQIVMIVGAIGLVVCGSVEGEFLYNQYKSVECMAVYDGEEELYRGKSAFFKTETRGNSTYFVEKEQAAWFPKDLQERISDKIHTKQLKNKECSDGK